MIRKYKIFKTPQKVQLFEDYFVTRFLPVGVLYSVQMYQEEFLITSPDKFEIDVKSEKKTQVSENFCAKKHQKVNNVRNYEIGSNKVEQIRTFF